MSNFDQEAVSILLVEDSVDEADFVKLLFGRSPDFCVTIEHACSIHEALQQIRSRDFDIVLLDLGLPDNIGVEAVGHLQQASPKTPIFVLTGDDRRETGLAAINAGAQDYLPKQHMVGRLLAQMTEHCIARQRRLRQAEQRSMIDELTKLGNRRGCDDLFHERLGRLRNGGDGFSVAIADIDKFKDVNDRYGHATGDDVIRAVGSTLQKTLGDGGVVFRYGGEEFAILMWDDHRDAIRDVMEDLRSTCETLCVGEDSHRITISIGGTTVETGETKRDIFERADAALYHSKETGRNRCTYRSRLPESETPSPKARTKIVKDAMSR